MDSISKPVRMRFQTRKFFTLKFALSNALFVMAPIWKGRIGVCTVPVNVAVLVAALFASAKSPVEALNVATNIIGVALK